MRVYVVLRWIMDAAEQASEIVSVWSDWEAAQDVAEDNKGWVEEYTLLQPDR